MTSRRDAIRLLTGMWASTYVPRGAHAQGLSPPLPSPALFESGDFVWPKKPGAFVPYAEVTSSPTQDAARWRDERKKYVQENSGSPSMLVRQRVQELEQMDYREFLARYAGAQSPGVPGAYSGGAFYVGHVAIIELSADNIPYVIEALWSAGVVRNTYEAWIKARADQVVWLGRIRHKTVAERSRIAQEARRYVGRPYDFWNFNLNDDSGFYCSKLCWLSTYRALQLAVDGNSSAERVLWFSPKQLLNEPQIEKLHEPGSY